MESEDVRNVGSRLARALLSGLVGSVAATIITFLLPTRDHFPVPPGGCGFGHWSQGWLVEGGDPTLMIAGAIAIAVACYGLLNALRWPRVRSRGGASSALPRARMHRMPRSAGL